MTQHTQAHADRLARAQGCLLGQLTGDTLGSMVEFQQAAAIARAYPRGLRQIGPSPVWGTLAGQPTDDSELAMVLARAILCSGGFSEQAAAGAYADWWESEPFDSGHTIRTATIAMVTARAHGQDIVAAARTAASRDSEANGALMRQSPLAIWGHALGPEALDACVRADTTLTHPNRVCQDASAAFIVALAAIIREGLDAEAAYALACEWDRLHGASPTITATLAAARTSLPRFNQNQGHVLVALQNAFYQALHAPGFEEGVVQTVMGGGDTDTNGAIAGALLGALHGIAAVPEQWREAVLHCRPERGRPDVRQPRPPEFWPVEVLSLAEQLLAI